MFSPRSSLSLLIPYFFLLFCVARATLQVFKWGHAFFELNAELLDLYATCEDGAAVIAAQDAYLRKVHEERELRRGVDDLKLGDSDAERAHGGAGGDEQDGSEEEEEDWRAELARAQAAVSAKQRLKEEAAAAAAAAEAENEDEQDAAS